MESSKILLPTVSKKNNKENSSSNKLQLHKQQKEEQQLPHNGKNFSVQSHTYLMLEKLLKERSENIHRIKENSDKFTSINYEISKIIKIIDKEQKKLDELFALVSSLNQTMSEQRKKLAELFEKREKTNPLLKTESHLSRQLRAVEYKFQTTTHLDRRKEREIILEAQDIARRIQLIRSKYSQEDLSSSADFEANIQSLKEKIKQTQKNRNQVGKEIDQMRAAIKELLSAKYALFKEKDALKDELQQLINKTSNTNEKIKEIKKGLRQWRVGMKIKNNSSSKYFSNDDHNSLKVRHLYKNTNYYNDDNIVIKNIRDEVQKKLDSGIKVSFDELKILYGSSNA